MIGSMHPINEDRRCGSGQGHFVEVMNRMEWNGIPRISQWEEYKR